MDKKIKFKDLSAKWLKNAVIGVTYAHKCNLESYVNHLNRAFGNRQAARIKPVDIDNIISSMYICNPNTGKPASKKLLKSIVGCASNVFEFAIENEIMYKNPAKGKKKAVPRNAPVKTINAIDIQQQKLVIATEHRAKIAAVLMMFTGLRTGEMLALEWNDVDLENLRIFVNKRLQRVSSNKYIVSDGTKNGKKRYVPIPMNLGEWLKKQKSLSNSYLVVPNKVGELNTITQWKKMWESYQNELNYQAYIKQCVDNGILPNSKYSPKGIPKVISKFNPHQLRHTYATMLYTSGVDVLTASELLGHSSIEITLKIYTHLDKQFKEWNITKFDEYIKSDLDIENI